MENGIFDQPSRPTDLTDTNVLAHIYVTHPQNVPWWMWNPLSELYSAIASALWNMKSLRDSPLVQPPPPVVAGKLCPSFEGKWPLTPY